jgi:hypothetical protein
VFSALLNRWLATPAGNTGRLALWGRSVPLAAVFDCAADLVPGWAMEACDRLVIAGRLRELPGGEMEVVEPGAGLMGSAA